MGATTFPQLENESMTTLKEAVMRPLVEARSLAKSTDGGKVLTAYALSAQPPKVIAAEPRVIEHLVAKLKA